MNAKSALRFLLGFATLHSLVAVVNAGGWSLITVKDFPDSVEAGKPLSLEFKVWAPSLEPMKGLHPVVHATNAKGREVRTAANAKPTPGEFTATLILPEPGDWVIAFDAEYENAATMPPLRVGPPGAARPAFLSLATQGLRLFSIKGCNGCHIHPDVEGGRTYGPDLTDKHFPADYLRRFLADPSITPVPNLVCSKDGTICGSPYEMPNLDLKKSEIEALVAFLTKR
jgi:hypothetical protein